MTGEVSIRGEIKPIGGIAAKIAAAVQAGIERVLIPAENWQENFNARNIHIIPVKRVEEVLKATLCNPGEKLSQRTFIPETNVLSASHSGDKGCDCTY